MLDFCLLHYFLSYLTAMTFRIVLSLLASLSNIFNKKTKLALYCIMLRVIPLGLALLYRYYPLTLENILSSVYYWCYSFYFYCYSSYFSFSFSLLYSEITCAIYATFVVQKCLFNYFRIVLLELKFT